MAVHTEYASPRFSPSSSASATRSPDTASPIYPDRAIRPLPRSRLKSKLSPQQATSIVYPPDPPLSPTIAFNNVQSPISNQTPRLVNGDARYHVHPYVSAHDDHCTCGDDGESIDEEVEFDHPDYRYAAAIEPLANGQGTGDSVQRKLLEAARAPLKPPPPGSTASSADGYESFENTSNKKKRKIPLSSTPGTHKSSLAAEMASMGLGHGDVDPDYEGHASVNYANNPSPSGTGISGAGRGRYGRQGNKQERRPLTTSVNAGNAYGARSPRAEGTSQAEDGVENNGGIISQAIKTAAKQGPLSPVLNRENVSLMKSASASSTPRTQFTFACESESATKMADVQASTAIPYPPAPRNGTYNALPPPTHGRQGASLPPNAAVRPPPPAPQPVVQSHGPPPAPAPRPKPRQRLSREYTLAARQRQLQQEYTNYHQRPTKDTMYICEFCEYEDIFGMPPVAMIRHYEIKDREERKKAAERRRLLEKAKMKNRKGKKNNKGGKGNNNNHNAANTQAHGNNPYDPNNPPPIDGVEEYYDDDEYGEEYDPVDGDSYDDALHDRSYYPPPNGQGMRHPSGVPAGGGTNTGRPPPIPSM